MALPLADDFRDKVLARLLELNKQRAEQERLTGKLTESKNQKSTKKMAARGRKKLENDRSPTLFVNHEASDE